MPKKEAKTPKYKLSKDDIHRLVNYATKVPSKAKELREETRKHIKTAIAAAFAFIIALTWRDAIRKSMDSAITKLGITETSFMHEIIIALIITIICVVGIMLISRYNVKKED